MKNSLCAREHSGAEELLAAADGDRRYLDILLTKLTNTNLIQKLPNFRDAIRKEVRNWLGRGPTMANSIDGNEAHIRDWFRLNP